jgi:UDP-N-acetyl-D-mannosaminuronic acid dehydrogenase
VGITLAAHLSRVQKSKVILMENNPQKLSAIQNGKYGVWEPELDQILDSAFSNGACLATSNFGLDALDVLFVTVGTPLPTESEKVDHPELLQTVVENSSALVAGGLIFLRSTVSIGTTETIKQMLREIGRDDISVYFAPERTAEGAALQELRELPQILGASDRSDIEKATRFLKEQDFTVFETENSKEAEFIKLACNSWRDLTFAFANELALIGHIESISSRNVITLANKDYSRSKIPMPGPSGGPCLTKDGMILTSSYKESKNPNSVIMKARQINENVNLVIFEKIKSELRKRPSANIVIAGIAFKGSPRTNDIRDGLGKYLLESLIRLNPNFEISAWDPYIDSELLFDNKLVKNSLFDGSSTDILVLANNSEYFQNEEFTKECLKMPKESVIIDCWQVLGKHFSSVAQQVTFGSSTWNS